MSELQEMEQFRPLRMVGEIPMTREPPQPAAGSPDLKTFLNILKRRRVVIFGCTTLFTLLCVFIILNLTPVYTAEAIVMLNTRKSQVVDLQAVLSGLQSDEAAVRTEVEVVKSRALAQRVVNELDLTANPLLNARLAPPTFWQKIDPIPSIKAAIQQWRSGGTDGDDHGAASDHQREDNDAVVSRVMSSLDIFNDGRSYVLKVRYQAANPILAAKIANAFADDYLQSQLDAKYEATSRATEWLNTHLADLRKKVEESDRAVQLYLTEHNLVGSSRDQTVITQQLSELNSQLTIANADLTQKESTLRQAQTLVRSGQTESVGQALSSPLIQSLKSQDAVLLQKQAELSTRYDSNHPAMVNILAQRKEVRAKLQDELANIIRGMDNDAAAARARSAALTAAIQKLQQEANAQDAAGVALRQLKREADANRTLYENLLNRFKETSTQEDIQQADARLVSSAVVPVLPTFPRVGLLIGLAFVLSFIAGVVLAFLREYFDRGVRSATNIERTLGIPFLGYVPELSSRITAHRHIVEEPRSAYAEALRSVRTALRFSSGGNPPKIIVVTSALPNEGKTVFAASLAQSVERSGGRSILVDCDLRHPSVAKLFGMRGPGLASYVQGRSTLADLIHSDANSRLDYITADERAAAPLDLLDSQHMRDVLSDLRNAYDCVVLDAPPVLAVSDAILLSHLADATVFIVRWEKTPQHVAMSGLRLLHSQGANLAGVVLSCVNVRRHAQYDYGDAAYYYARHRGYYLP